MKHSQAGEREHGDYDLWLEAESNGSTHLLHQGDDGSLRLVQLDAVPTAVREHLGAL